ncbi:MAG: ATP-binding protein, partial [Candidatus Desantisbacteria bacterium]
EMADVNQKLYDAHQKMVEICKELHKVTSRLEENVESQSQQLMTIESSYRSIFENVLEGIFQITEDGKILLAIPAMVNMLNYDSCEQLMDAVPNVFQQLFVCPERGEEFRQRISAGMVHSFEAGIYTKDNNIIWVLLSANAVHGKGMYVYYEGVMINITEHKKLEEKLLKVEKAEAVAKLAGETAHEIRNPLQVIQTGLYLLKMTAGKEDEKTSTTIKQMEHAVQRACKFIDELIDSSRIPELNISYVNINSLLEGVVNEINIPSSIKVDLELDKSLPNIPADSERLYEVMHNLIKNAIESMEQSSREKELRIKTELEKEFVKITISDTGKGMSEDELSNIWTAFYTSKSMGKGLGMTIVKRLVESHKGRIDVESKVDAGTRVVVRLMRSM